MDDQEITAALDGFDDVWQRVGSAQAASAEEQTLRSFIDDETCDAAFYIALSHMFQGAGKALLLAHAADEKSHARRLRAEYFIRTGVTYAPGGACEPVSGKLSSLRIALQHELAGASAYRKAAAQTSSPELREVYLRHAADEDRHAQEDRALILDSF